MPVNRNDIAKWLQSRLKANNDAIAALKSDGDMLTAALALLQQPQPKPLPPGYLSPNFSLAEMIKSSTAMQYNIENVPDETETDALSVLCNETLEKIRSLCGNNPVIVTSGFRNKQVNQLVGGATNSAHLYGCAADFTIPNFGSVRDTCKKIEANMRSLGIDQLIFENNSWVHVGRAIPPSTTPRYQVLTINGGSTVNGIV